MNEKNTFEDLVYIQNELKLKGKRTFSAYILLMLLGQLGLHYAYLEKVKMAIARIFLSLVSFFALFSIYPMIYKLQLIEVNKTIQAESSAILAVNLILLLLNCIWFIYDLIEIPKMVRLSNEKIELRAADRAKSARNLETSKAKEIAVNELIENVYNATSRDIENMVLDEKHKYIEMKNDLTKENEKVNDILTIVKENTAELERAVANLLNEEESSKKTQVNNVLSNKNTKRIKKQRGRR